MIGLVGCWVIDEIELLSARVVDTSATGKAICSKLALSLAVIAVRSDAGDQP
jgi:hypothetical protein